MADQTDFTQIPADFAANLKSVGSADDGAAADGNTSAEGTLVHEGSKAVILPVEVIGSETDPAVSDDIETDGTTARQDSAEHADLEISPSEEAATDHAADGGSDGNRSHIVSGEHDATEPATAKAGTDNGIFVGFPAAPHQPGEFQLPLCDLVIGKMSDGGIYDFDTGAAESLRHAVKAPETIAPIVVTRSGNAWHVTDGWARVDAFRAQFGNTANVMVRVVEWTARATTRSTTASPRPS